MKFGQHLLKRRRQNSLTWRFRDQICVG